jgi:hypothetical protein
MFFLLIASYSVHSLYHILFDGLATVTWAHQFTDFKEYWPVTTLGYVISSS